ncbi:MAG TPA: DUF6209 family protein [Polyangiaceae bacterium]|jgi:hypothetical protein
MRYASGAGVVPALALVACSGGSPADATGSLASAVSAGDSADTSCQVVLRHTDVNFESSLGPETDCSSGTCWVVIPVTFDVAMSESLAEAEAFVLYQGEGSATWQQSVQAEPVSGCDELPDGPCAPVGFRRYQVTLRTDTFTTGPGDTTVSFIPFLQVGGGRLFDHNRVADPVGSYSLTAQNNWTISDDAAACPGAAPAGRLTATFATGWQNSSTGTLAGGGKLDVAYDVYRMPATLGCTSDGVDAFATTGYVQFEPSGTVLSELLTGTRDATTGEVESLPLEFDVPAGARSAALWFMTSSECTGANQWDSDYGQNYVFSAE